MREGSAPMAKGFAAGHLLAGRAPRAREPRAIGVATIATRPAGRLSIDPMVSSCHIHPGAIHLPGYLSIDEQRALLALCREVAGGPAGPYTPTVRGGATMRIQMLCLGLHWNALTYRYEPSRSDFDGLPAPPLPPDLSALARRVAGDAGMQIDPDICILNFYPAGGRLGLHQDKDERPDTLAAGVPVVSLSLGDSAKFMLGGTRRKDRVATLILHSGDAFVLGGESRLRYHGVSAILPGTAPPGLGLEGRVNLTFRQY
jgi:DNA oxidative demethylase